MPLTLTVHDETATRTRTHSLTLEMLSADVSVRELIRSRVYQEVQDFNRASANSTVFRGLVQPSDTEKILNGVKPSQKRALDWEKQYETALAAFEKNGFIVLIDNRQAESLDENVHLAAETEISFVKLVPLVGG